MKSASRLAALALVFASALALAACSSSPSGAPATSTTAAASSGTTPTAPPASSTTTSPITAAANEYTTLVAPADAAEKAWKNANTTSATEAASGPFADALQTWANKLVAYSWPPTATADVHALISDIAPLVGDLEQLSSEGALSVNVSQMTADESRISTATVLVRHDLGLPQT